MQAAPVAKNAEELYDMLMDRVRENSPDEIDEQPDPTKMTDAERVKLYEKIITGVLGKDYYDSLNLNT